MIRPADDTLETITTLAVLAGGEGRRMGGPKSWMRIDDVPILHWLLDRLQWHGPTLLVTAAGREHPPGWQRFDAEVSDSVTGQGPLRGIVTALEHARTTFVVAIPVDMPFLIAAGLNWFVQRLNAHPNASVMMAGIPEDAGLNPQPLPVALRTEPAKDLVDQYLCGRRFAIHELATDPGAIIVPCPPQWPADFWTNLNFPQDQANLQISGARS